MLNTIHVGHIACLFISIVGGGVLWTVISVIRASFTVDQERRQENMEFAAFMGWEAPPGAGDHVAISGRVEGFLVEVRRSKTIVSHGARREGTPSTQIGVDFTPPLPTALHIYEDRLGEGHLLKMVGPRDIKTGDKAFDAHFVVAATDEATALRLLHSQIREALLTLRGTGLHLDVNEKRIILSTKAGISEDPHLIKDAVVRVAALATMMTRC